ncbi:hypothetical protein SDJN03_19260, partial [Cucurbita argyrosperma subsp. sororia]
MMQDGMMVGALSHSTAVGKLLQDLPDVPLGARVNFPCYSLDEAASVFQFPVLPQVTQALAYGERRGYLRPLRLVTSWGERLQSGTCPTARSARRSPPCDHAKIKTEKMKLLRDSIIIGMSNVLVRH